MGWRGRVRDRRRGQSTLEYILVLAAILVAVIAAANTWLRPAVDTAVHDSANTITNATGRVSQGLGLQ